MVKFLLELFQLKPQGFHGGAWKVAYADFVTALMALFMVLWIVSQDKDIVLETAQYFKQPFGVGLSNKQSGFGKRDSAESEKFTLRQQKQNRGSVVDLAMLHKLANQFYKSLNIESVKDPTDKPINVDVTSDGICITIFNDGNKPIFDQGTADLTEYGTFLLQNVAWLLDQNKMKIRIDSHTEAGFGQKFPDSDPWQVTVDRSNNARRALEGFTLTDSRVKQVSGYADTKPIEGVDPSRPENQRLEISLLAGEPI